MIPVRRALLVAVLLAMGVAAPAGAIPSDPPVAPLTPADGATLATDQAGIGVTFGCPVYNQAEPQTIDGVTYTFRGSAADYFVDFATSPQTGSDGRFVESARVALSTPSSSNELPADVCSGVMRSDPRTVPGVELVPGVYYWQVVRNLSSCLGCTPSYETGPVRSFTLRNDVALTVDPQMTVFSGYDHRFGIGATGVPDGFDVVLERRRGGNWEAIGRGAAREARAVVVGRLPRGRQTVRVAFESGGQRSYGEPRTVTVRDGRKARRQTRGAAGSWTGRAEGAPERSRFRVTKGGREIRGLRVPVLLGCPNPGPSGGEILLRAPGVIEIGRIRVAPDGRFAKVQADEEGVAEVSGRLRGGRLQEGTAALVRGECTISGGWASRRS